MQLFTLILVLAVFAHDFLRGPDVAPWPMGGWWLAVVVLPKLVLASAYAGISHRTLSRLQSSAPRSNRPRGGITGALRLQDRAAGLYRNAMFASHYIDLVWVGTLGYLRAMIGDLILLDELAVLIVPIAMMVFSWWVYYPIDRRLRDAVLIRQLDAGLPVHPVWTRRQYLSSQLRHQVLAMLIPLALLLLWTESVDRYGLTHWSLSEGDPRPVMLLIGCGGLLLVAPVMIRYVWDTVPLPQGPLRDELTRMCQRYRVGVRQLLLWRTYGCLVNGAVMGLIAPVRYILLTDALLERLPQRQVEAVMAHELAHIYERHLIWLMAVAAGTFAVLSLVWAAVFDAFAQGLGLTDTHLDGQSPAVAIGSLTVTAQNALSAATVVAMIVCWFFIFGWVSRRFERQADTFAVAHLSRVKVWQSHDTQPHTIDDRCVSAMTEALQNVADLNHLSPVRPSWRHGSIAWRQAYLRRLIGQSTDDLPIDRQIYWLKLTTATLLVGVFLFRVPLPQWLSDLL